MTNRKTVLPGDEDFPFVSPKQKPSDYAVNGFNKSPI